MYRDIVITVNGGRVSSRHSERTFRGRQLEWANRIDGLDVGDVEPAGIVERRAVSQLLTQMRADD